MKINTNSLMKIFIKTSFLTFLFIFQTICYSQTSTIWYVTPTGAGSNNGQSRANAWNLSSINQSLIQPGDYVYFGQGYYTGSFNPTKSGTPGKIITFMADPTNNTPVVFRGYNGSHGFTYISGVHHIRIKGIKYLNNATGIYIQATVKTIYLDSLEMRNVNSIFMYGSGSGNKQPSECGIDSVWIRWCKVICDTQLNAQTDLIACYGGQNNTFLLSNWIENLNTAGDTPSGQHVDCIQFYNYTGNITYANNFIHNVCTYNSQAMMNGDSWAGYRSLWYNNVISTVGSGVAQYFASSSGGTQVPDGRGIMINNTFYCNANGTTTGQHFEYTDTIYYKNNIASVFGDCGPAWFHNSVYQINPADKDYNMWHVDGENSDGPRLNSSCIDFNSWHSHGVDAHGMGVPNPYFQDRSNQDFRLTALSPAINAGNQFTECSPKLGNTWGQLGRI